jgi:MYXO-CTERM domain-containing protein
MSKRISSSKTYLGSLTFTGTRRSSNPNARSSLLGRASGGAAAAALAVAFLAPKSAQAQAFFTDLTTTNFPNPQVCLSNADGNPGTGPATKPGCFTHWLVSSDLDQDGDLDLMFANGGAYYLTGNSESSTAYVNDGTGMFTDVTATMFGGALNRIRQVAIGDIDSDGDRDILQLGSYGVNPDKVWIQTSPGVYEDQASTRLPAGSKSKTAGYHLGDLDNDGDLDLVVADWGLGTVAYPVVLSLFLNDGTGKFTKVESQVEPSVSDPSLRLPPTISHQPTSTSGTAIVSQPYWGQRAIDIDFADIDGDFDLDILVNMRNGISRILLNDGDAHFKDGNGDVRYQKDENGNVVLVDGRPFIISNYPMKFGPYVYNQEVCDFDNDGDLDLLLDNAGRKPAGLPGNVTQILANDGTGKFSDVTLDKVVGEPGADDNAVKCADVNNDGRYDLVVASLGTFEKLLVQDADGKFNYVAGGIPAVNDDSLGLDMGDFDGDGIFDLVTGQGEGGDYTNRLYKGVADPAGAAADTLPPKFRKIETPTAVAGKPIVLRMAITDAVTSETGEHIKTVSVTYAGIGVAGTVTPKFIGGDLWRVEIPAQPAYKTLTITANAVDRRNPTKAYSSAVTVTVQPVPAGSGGNGGTSGAGGTGGTDPGTGGAPEAGAGGEPSAGGAPDGSGGAPDGSGGTPDGSGGTPDGSGGVPSEGSGGKGGSKPSGSAGEESGEGGEGGSSTGSSGGKKDDGGCTVTSAATGSSTGGLLAAIGLALAAGLRRRRRGQ